MKRSILVIIPLLFAVIGSKATLLGVKNTAFGTAESQCMQSFVDFAYGGPEYWSQRQTEHALSGWQIESTVPPGPSNVPVDYPAFSVELSRVFREEQEIWVSGVGQEGAIWLIYKPESQEWEIVPRGIGNTGLYSGDLLLTKDTTVWSRTQWYPQINIETAPVLSIFNEDTRCFETADVPIEIPVSQEAEYYYGQAVLPWPEIIIDERNIFWILVNFDGIYRYNPVTQAVERVVDLSDTPINEAVLSTDGSIYFSKPSEIANTTKALVTLTQGMLRHFKPDSGDIETIKTPKEEWPVFSGMLVDHNGWLWLGSIGYRDLNETWHLIHSNTEEFFDNAGDPSWATPMLILESSDGRLWYTRFLDGGGEGTAWYDPEANDGCLILGHSSIVIEDSKQQLWMVANGKLYRYSLNR